MSVPHDFQGASWEYSPEEDDQVTRLFREEATEEAMIDAFLASLATTDAQRELIPFRLQREFLTRRRVQPFKA
jgi:hypothetical protein